MRGAIEGVTRNRVFGWIWSPDASLAGKTVLAFLDEACIGSGRVERERQDLKEAGLGDGVAGFEFDLTYENPADAARIIVRLDGSDVVLIQPKARIMPPGSSATLRVARHRPSLASLQWMRGKGWLDQSGFDFLRLFRQQGVYQRSLVLVPGDPKAPMLDAADTARSMLELDRMEEGSLRRERVETPRGWRTLAEEVELADGPGAVLALWSDTTAPLPVLEGSHLKPPVIGAEASPPSVPYTIGPDRLLLLDARTMLAPDAAFPPAGVDVFHLGA